MHFFYIARVAGLVAGVVFITAFILTLWPGRRRLVTAAVLYAVGLLACMGCFAYFTGGFTWMMYGMSDTGSPKPIAFVGLIWPIWAVGYAGVAIAFLWPSISQKKALWWGKIVHLVIGFPFIATHTFGGSDHAPVFEVGWLVYALLWFRIRESYPTFLNSRNLEPQ
jgi:hypothetical protein